MANLRKMALSWKSWALLSPVLLLACIEFFVDPFPNSLWLLRILNTKYLVHVRADLTVDGEPLVMERTIRCFKPADYFWYPGAAQRGDVMASDGQAGDTLTVITSKGRLFAMTGLNVCHALGSRLGPNGQGYVWTDPAAHNVTPLRLSRDEIEMPIVFEIHGGRSAEQIDAYIARDLLRQGYHGVRLNELLIEKSSETSLLTDWNGYDWFGKANWFRSWSKNGTLSPYEAGYIIDIPPERWEKLEQIWPPIAGRSLISGQKPEVLWGYVEFFKSLHQDTIMQINNQSRDMLISMFWSFVDAEFAKLPTDLQLRPMRNLQKQTGLAWALDALIPCVFDSKDRKYVCHPDHNGILEFKQLTWEPVQENIRHGQVPYQIGSVNIPAQLSSYTYYFRAQDRHILITNQAEAYLRRKE